MTRKNREAAPPFPSWRGVPDELTPELYHVSFYARATAIELFRVFAARSRSYSGAVEFRGDWEDWVLGRYLEVHGKQRNNVVRHLRELKEAGVIRVSAGTVTVCIGQPLAGTQPEALCENSAGTLPELCATSVSTLPELCERSSPQNDSTLVRQSRTEQIERESRAESATAARVVDRPEDIGFRFVASLLGRSTFDVPPLGAYPRQYASIGGRPQSERDIVRAAVEADPWCVANPQDVDAPHLERRWQKYLAGPTKPVLKAMVATQREQFEQARERLRAARIEVNRLDGLPWFDRESPKFPARRERAVAEVTAATTALAELERGGAAAVAS